MIKIVAPSGWKKTDLDNVAEVQTGIAKGKAINGASVTLPYLRVANVQDGHVDLSIIKEITIKPTEVVRYSLRKGDVLFTEGGDFDKLGRGTVWNGEIEPCLHQNHVFAVRPNSDQLLPEFLAFQAACQYGRRYFQLSSKQSTNLASINSTQLKQFPVLLPPLPEQRKIAEILRTWDEAIEKLEQAIALKKDRFYWLRWRFMQPESSGTKSKFGSFLKESRIPDDVNDPEKRLTVRLHFKGVMTRDYRGTESKDATKYFRRRAGQLIYGKQNIFRGSIGVVPQELDGYSSSQDIPAFDVDQTKVNTRWLLWHMSNPHFYEMLEHYAAGSGSKRLHPSELFKRSISLPDLKEQERVVGILDEAWREIVLLQEGVSAVSTQKRGIMQKLLTGEWRVKEGE